MEGTGSLLAWTQHERTQVGYACRGSHGRVFEPIALTFILSIIAHDFCSVCLFQHIIFLFKQMVSYVPMYSLKYA